MERPRGAQNVFIKTLKSLALKVGLFVKEELLAAASEQHQSTVNGPLVAIVRKDIEKLHLGVYPRRKNSEDIESDIEFLLRPRR
jgi:hypothetical protein